MWMMDNSWITVSSHFPCNCLSCCWHDRITSLCWHVVVELLIYIIIVTLCLHAASSYKCSSSLRISISCGIPPNTWCSCLPLSLSPPSLLPLSLPLALPLSLSLSRSLSHYLSPPSLSLSACCITCMACLDAKKDGEAR